MAIRALNGRASRDLHRPPVTLDEVGDDAREYGQDKEGDLLCEERTNQWPVIYRLHRGLYRRCCAFSLLFILG